MQNKGLAFEEPAARLVVPAGDRLAGALPTPRGVPAQVLDPKALAALRQLDPTGTNGFLKRVLNTFLSSAARLAARFVEARRVDDRKNIRLVVHTLRSSSAHVGASALVALCGRIEWAIAQGADADLNPDLDAFAPLLELTLTAVRQRLCCLE